LKKNLDILIERGDAESPFVTVVFCAVISSMIIFFVFVVFFLHCTVYGSSMQPTLHTGDVILVSQYKTRIKSGDIIILDERSNKYKKVLIKRAAATEGEVFKFVKVGEYVDFYKKNSAGNFEKIIEPYINGPMKDDDFNKSLFTYDVEYTVPENHIFFLGDNRNDSSDSRAYNYARTEYIIGEKVFIAKKGTLFYFFLSIIYGADPVSEDAKL
jgi:signal peptidase I